MVARLQVMRKENTLIDIGKWVAIPSVIIVTIKKRRNAFYAGWYLRSW